MKKLLVKITLVVISLVFFVACEQPSIEKNGISKHKGHEYVDLGLSVKWATCNIGANSPEEYGDYFAWGEINSKDIYSMDNYKYANMGNLTKYNHIDNKTTLDFDDDAARVNWGGKWRMPSVNECMELVKNCDIDIIEMNGVDCYKFTSKIEGYTDKNIFLPAGIIRSSADAIPMYGVIFWTNEILGGFSYAGACCVVSTSPDILSEVERWFYLPIRPVCP